LFCQTFDWNKNLDMFHKHLPQKILKYKKVKIKLPVNKYKEDF